ncbi:RDD family protein [uncultured Stenotrophomonas sp.]|uniref:RDD family protein n=1 Tax=uncultured Stenotrophomonas sp. TaxID=165438 RepID=UPI0025DCD5F3|nr:RDD family protein [uncultured Stenotrophomonas sp.]
MSQWYYADAQRERHGPIEADALREKFRAGEIDLGTLVWREGMQQWQPLSAIADELQLITQASTGIDLRQDYAAIESGEAVVARSAAEANSPYAAPASRPQDVNPAAVQGGLVVQAGFWKRVAAYFIDYVILTTFTYIVLIPLSILGAIVGGVSGGSDSAAGSIGMFLTLGIGYLIIFVGNLMYPAWMHSSKYQATLGKMAVGIKVVRSNGERLTMGRAVGRFFAYILSSITLCIGFVMAAFTERKQALHDIICDTLVVDKHAFTDHPEWQQQGLGTVTIVILSLAGLGLLCLIGLFVLLGVAAAGLN